MREPTLPTALMRTIAITNQKGGSGKTTTAVNLAAALGEAGRRVLVIDMDPQASASAWLGATDGGSALLDVLHGEAELSGAVRETPAPNVSLVPSSIWLSNAERVVAGQPGAETILRGAIAQLPRDTFDVVLVDCPPTLGFLSISALVGCTETLVPVEARFMALPGTADLMRTVEQARRRLNAALTVTGFLPCRADARTNLSREVIARLREQFDTQVFTTVIRENVRLAEAPSYRLPITQYAPQSPGAEDYRAAAAELLTRVPLPTPAQA